MKMIRKISVTASTLLFLLAQIFSFYLIYQTQSEKISILIMNEENLLLKCLSQLNNQVGSKSFTVPEDDVGINNLVKYVFSLVMPENSAIYKENISIFNNSGYEFEIVENKEMNESEIFHRINKQLNGRNVMILYRREVLFQESYMVYHVLDVTDIYDMSRRLILKEVLMAFCMSLGMAFLLCPWTMCSIF